LLPDRFEVERSRVLLRREVLCRLGQFEDLLLNSNEAPRFADPQDQGSASPLEADIVRWTAHV
jgi:hypothetical protein